jgi:hypothetical protein
VQVSKLSHCLSVKGLSIFYISAWDSDYVLVHEAHASDALQYLTLAGCATAAAAAASAATAAGVGDFTLLQPARFRANTGRQGARLLQLLHIVPLPIMMATQTLK